MPRKKPVLSCPDCGGPIIGGIHWRSYCLECGKKPYPLPRAMATTLGKIDRIDPDDARAKIAEELKDSPVTFDPTHPSNE